MIDNFQVAMSVQTESAHSVVVSELESLSFTLEITAAMAIAASPATTAPMNHLFLTAWRV